MIKAVIFDMFETLITHFEAPVYMAKQIAEDIGITEQKFREVWNTTDEARTLGKMTHEQVIEMSLRANDCYSPELLAKIVRKRKDSKVECFRHLHPEILPMLAAIRASGIRIGLITNCYYEESDAIRESVLFDYFDAVCMSCELGLQKPDPRIFHKCAEDLAVAPEECLYVGDGGSAELEAAREVGMHPVQAVWYFKEGAKQPAKRKEGFFQAESPMEIVDLCKKK